MVAVACLAWPVLADGETDDRALQTQLLQAFAAKDYDKAETLATQLVERHPKSSAARYNLACAQARQGKQVEAVASLTAATDLGYANPLHMLDDEDLASLRTHESFVDLLLAARVNQKTAEQKGSYEKGREIEGVKTVEGEPDKGLRWRLRMSPDATAESPQKLIVWLHPSGGSMNAHVERLAPRLNRAGYAMAVFTQKKFVGWTSEDIDRLMKHTLADIGKTPGVDAKKPILFGYSAGGQAALLIWADQAEELGGMILDAAYPLDMEAYSRGKMKTTDPPAGDAPKAVPIFSIVGEKDGGLRLWQQVWEPWRQAGVPLELNVVRGKGHSWLFGPAQLKLLDAWLEKVAAGKLPGKAEAGDEDAKEASEAR
jgi:predicted esterase